MHRDAFIEGPHRYSLSRLWDARLGRVAWCMLNPSTADGLKDDHTIRKCIGFSTRWGYGSLTVVNLFSWRSRHPRDVVANLADAAGATTDRVIMEVARASEVVVVAWGREAGRTWVEERAGNVVGLLGRWGPRLECLGVNQDGSPRHPLTVPYAQSRLPFPRLAEVADG